MSEVEKAAREAIYDWLDAHVKHEELDFLRAPEIGAEWRAAAEAFGVDPLSEEYKAAVLSFITLLMKALAQEEQTGIPIYGVSSTYSTLITTLAIACFWEDYITTRHPREEER